MSGYVGANSVAEKTGKLYWGDGASLAQAVQKAYWGDPRGVAELWYQLGTPLGDRAVGGKVYFNVNNIRTEWIIVHQGLPGAMYDASCSGAWLLMKDIYESRQWRSSNRNDYANSTIHSYLNSTFLNLVESNIKNAIKQVKLPYREGSGAYKTVASGSNGLSAKIFLLSAAEVSLNVDVMPSGEGAELVYFKGCADESSDSKRVAKLNGSAISWWLRSPWCAGGSGQVMVVSSKGDYGGTYCTRSNGVRPALILPSTTLVDGEGNVLGG